MSVSFEVSDIIPASPKEIYDAWLDSDGHTKMTGATAKVSNKVGGKFEAWDGYIHGSNLELTPGKRIVQAWRTEEFDAADPDSRLEIDLEPVEGGAQVTIKHSALPAHGMQYEQGWIDNYFEPMKDYFAGAG